MDNFATLQNNLSSLNHAVGQGFWDAVFAHPMLYVGYIFAFVAAIGVLTFLRGFLSGFSFVVTMDWHEEHQEHYRTYATQGFFILLYLYIVWELLRWIVGGVTGLIG
ncbi:MAG TPA: hypothetical protein VGP13_04250 [Candidatus Paceibacterota bacterium]|jgi:hypothetical protein|nr:hypothetical protein [Candidatus Paceibacterota bacterium]